MATLRIIKSSSVCSIQDKGRFGYRKWGIPQSGYMDAEAANYAHHLVGNAPGGALIEYALGSLVVEVDRELAVAVVGSGDPLHSLLKPGKPCTFPRPIGNYSYLAVGGTLQVNTDFGSASAYPPAKFGGLAGSYLKAGDQIEVKEGLGQPSAFSVEASPPKKIRITKGPEFHLMKEGFTNKTFSITTESTRMAIRLEGKLQSDQKEIRSSAVVLGIMQLPPAGNPIILMNDCPTTGGYPRVAKILDKDLGRLAQKPFGSEISFELLDSF